MQIVEVCSLCNVYTVNLLQKRSCLARLSLDSSWCFVRWRENNGASTSFAKGAHLQEQQCKQNQIRAADIASKRSPSLLAVYVYRQFEQRSCRQAQPILA